MKPIRHCRAKAMRFFASIILIFFTHAFAIAQATVSLPRSTPEAEGVSSQGILDFIQAAGKSKTEFHSFMLLRHGKVIAEAWWSPYAPNLRHTLYSCSKSFTATAIGLAIQEKKLALTDRVVTFFPQDLPDTLTPYLLQLTIKDVLMMADGQEPEPSFRIIKDSNWIKSFLATPIKYAPGSVFLYNSMGTYMLSAILQRVTGETVLQYLKPRLFDPLGITGMDWETDLQGIDVGGWGLRLKTEDMAKFAQLFLQKGMWNGKQILSESWVNEASSLQILQEPQAAQSKRDSSDWLQGYGYQMWRCRNHAFRGDGAYGQFMIVMPDQDAVVAITAETANMQEEINLVWDYLLPALNGQPGLKETPSGNLQSTISSLKLLPPAGVKGRERAINKKSFTVQPNELHLQQLSFEFENNICTLNWKTDSGDYKLTFAKNSWQPGETKLEVPALFAGGRENTSMLYPAKTAGSYRWKDAKTLEFSLRYVESPHTRYFVCSFSGDTLHIFSSRSNDFGKARTEMIAKLDK